MDNLFEKIVELSELSPLFARQSLERALKRAGLEPRTLNASTLRQAMPEIRKTLEAFLNQRAEHVAKEIERLSK